MYLNKAMIYGNLTRDPEMRSLPSGIMATTFSLATNRVWKDKDGARQESPDFHNVVVFGRQAETVSQYLRKGSAAFVEGRMQTRSWDADGVKKYRTEIVADRVQFGPKNAGGSSGAGGGGGQAAYTPSTVQQPVTAGAGESAIEYPEEEINPEDIPF